MEEILEILENNARVSLEDLEKLTGKSQKEISRAIKDYEKKGVIVKYKTVVNRQKIKGQRGVRALIEVKVAPQKDVGFDLVAERIYRFPEVKSCYLLSGTYDLLLVVEGDDINTVASFVSEKLAPLSQVRGTATHFMLKKYKEDGVILTKLEKSQRLAITY
ncbi:MAG: Lrp/AsnC family transcriptional regulator [Candidatus Omnitrophica bacterium]|nr:Lrp/AsnC family transcriptional regulator [Candidatus Omnitrophota bacterium]MBU2044262.1 Lrp/AsnC family transcriptional regulator [Candidatus Omnitrophota bacterium]MBU2251512.1 Lrp/AsnC family transcriptional regulator [Candidatus Omnitrophota bacterium]MBU2474061.1 Lrp/AsnC family transcriptional regulator [Candidatus Omnitrophota bacterium]